MTSGVVEETVIEVEAKVVATQGSTEEAVSTSSGGLEIETEAPVEVLEVF